MLFFTEIFHVGWTDQQILPATLSVMPMEIFVSCGVDLATLGRVRVALDLGLFSPLVCSIFFFLCVCVCVCVCVCSRDTGGWKVFTLAFPLRSGRFEFLSWGDSSKSHEGTRLWTYIRPERKWIAALFRLDLEFLGFLSLVRSTDRGLQTTPFLLFVNFALDWLPPLGLD